MSRATDQLRHEHEAILHAIEILSAMDRRMTNGASVAADDAAAFVGFLKEFADRCHHGKEEGLLFPAMVRAGVPERGGPVGVMLSEHEDGRHWIRDMEAATQPALDAAAFTRAARGYAQLLQTHIWKENNVLFPMADQVLPPEQQDALFDAFEAHEVKLIGPGRHNELHALLKSLAAKYAA